MVPESRLEQLISRLKGDQEKPPDVSVIAKKLEEIKKRELRRYKEAQDKKWTNWLEAMKK